MQTLATLQRDFQNYVLGRQKRVVREVQCASRSGAVARMDVYARAYELRLLEVLRADFPALHVLAGDNVFEAVGRAYIHAHPSDSPNARWFGRRLDTFLARSNSFPQADAMAEMARFEWAVGLAFDAPDQAALSLEQLATVSAERFSPATFLVHPSVQLLSLIWNVPAFWKAVESKVDPSPVAAARAPVQWVVWRPELTTYFRSLERDEKLALDAVVEGKSFASVCESLSAIMEPLEVPPRAAQLVRRWTEEGLLAGIQFHHTSDDLSGVAPLGDQ